MHESWGELRRVHRCGWRCQPFKTTGSACVLFCIKVSLPFDSTCQLSRTGLSGVCLTDQPFAQWPVITEDGGWLSGQDCGVLYKEPTPGGLPGLGGGRGVRITTLAPYTEVGENVLEHWSGGARHI